MPVLEISDGQGNLNFDSRSHVMAWLLYPDDESRRIDYETLHFTEFLLSRHANDDDMIRVPKAALSNLMLCPSLNEFEASLMDACFWGETVGELVIIVQNLRREIGADTDEKGHRFRGKGDTRCSGLRESPC